MNGPAVSVVVPAFNAAWCVGKAIDSVLAQTFRDFELIVVDDGSTDGTADALARYGNAITVVRQPNGGMSNARNAGIKRARGRYLAFLDADDRWLPEKLARQVSLLETDPTLVFCAAKALLEDADGHRQGEWCCSRGTRADVSEIFANHAAVAGGASSVLARRDAVVELGGFDEALYGAEDTDLWIRLAAHGGFACIDDPLVVVLRRTGSVSRRLESMRAGALAMTRKNRRLLPAGKRGAFWRSIYAGVLCDYAKWEYREGRGFQAFADLAKALLTAPLTRGRLATSLIIAMARRQRV